MPYAHQHVAVDSSVVLTFTMITVHKFAPIPQAGCSKDDSQPWSHQVQFYHQANMHTEGGSATSYSEFEPPCVMKACTAPWPNKSFWGANFTACTWAGKSAPAVPLSPHVHVVGGLTPRPAKQLPPELLRLCEASQPSGVVYVSMGTTAIPGRSVLCTISNTWYICDLPTSMLA